MPTASTTSDTCGVLRPSTRPSTNDEAVMVATVADPVANRISTASSQASNSRVCRLSPTASEKVAPKTKLG